MLPEQVEREPLIFLLGENEYLIRYRVYLFKAESERSKSRENEKGIKFSVEK